MNISAGERRPFGALGLTVPPIIFGTAALGNVSQTIPEKRKFEICGEWFQHVSPPVFLDAAYEHGDGLAVEVLGRMLHRLGVEGNEVVVHLTLNRAEGFADNFEKSCRLLGSEYRPKLVSICCVDESAWRFVNDLKAAGQVFGVGVAASDFGTLSSLTPPVDWMVLTRGFTVMRHPPKVLDSMSELARRQIPIVVSGVFDAGFLVGGNRLDGRVLSPVDPADRSFLAWRTSFVALCHGHGVTPAQACIQFALSGPGVVAVMLNSSHPDRVAANVGLLQQRVPDVFWASMKEEGLLAADYPLIGM